MIASAAIPAPAPAAARSRGYVQQLFKHLAYSASRTSNARAAAAFTRDVFDDCGERVVAGPFAGMKYRLQACGSLLIPKLLGTYEEELHPWINAILGTNYATIIDVGCGEGYYAVGLALRCKSAPQVLAYDKNPVAREATQKLAALNAVADRVTVRETCDWAELDRVVANRTLVFCDIEGAEYDLLDPARCEGLLKCDLLVECHDGLQRTKIKDALRARFQPTHSIQHVHFQDRDARPLPTIAFPVPQRWARFALREARSWGLDWYFMQPHPAT